MFSSQCVLHASQKLNKERRESQVQQVRETLLRIVQYTTPPVIFDTCIDQWRKQHEHAHCTRQFHELCRPFPIQCPDSRQHEEASKQLRLVRAIVKRKNCSLQNIQVSCYKLIKFHTDAATQSGVQPRSSALSTSALRSMSSDSTSLRLNCFRIKPPQNVNNRRPNKRS